ncbi:hypothetical protein MPER_12133, partial [Moniliophthora perniciosa FA553]
PTAKLPKTKTVLFGGHSAQSFALFTNITVTIIGRDSEKLDFTSGPVRLEARKSHLKLFCPNPTTGTFMLDSSEIRISRLLLQWNYRKPAGKGSRSSFKPFLIKLPRDNLAFNIESSPPPEVELDGKSKLLIRITTGRNYVKHVTIDFSSPTAKFDLKDAILLTNDGTKLEATDDQIIFQDIPDNNSVELLIPHSHVPGGQDLKLMVEAKYVTASELSVTRTLRSTMNVSVSLPISVNVEDFFRGTRLFSKFTISTLTHQHVRVAGISLDVANKGAGDVSIVSSISRVRPLYTVKPAQPTFMPYSKGAITLTGPISHATGRSQIID